MSDSHDNVSPLANSTEGSGRENGALLEWPEGFADKDKSCMAGGELGSVSDNPGDSDITGFSSAEGLVSCNAEFDSMCAPSSKDPRSDVDEKI